MHNKQKAVGLLYGPEESQLDHLASVCMLMKIPLIVTEDEIEKLAKKYYPDLEILHCDYRQIGEFIVSNYEILFSTLPKFLIEEIFFLSQRRFHKRLHSIWCPQGNSDKENKLSFIEKLPKEEIALAYGQKMVEFFQQKGAFDELKALVVTGNFRYALYRKKREFYNALLLKEIRPFSNKTILYSPTWQDSEHSSSFFSATPLLIDNLPDSYFLIIKLDPYLMENEKTEYLIRQYENHPQVQFIKHFPPIYPLLEICDIYIGDLSSVGYDFLVFNKPMFFLNESGRDARDPGLYLYRCGVEIPLHRYSDIYKLIEYHLPSDREDFSQIRQRVYRYAFGEEKEEESLRQEIVHTYQSVLDSALDFL